MAKCPYCSEHNCIALDLYRSDYVGNRYPYSPCTKDCNQLRIKHLEEICNSVMNGVKEREQTHVD